MMKLTHTVLAATSILTLAGCAALEPAPETDDVAEVETATEIEVVVEEEPTVAELAEPAPITLEAILAAQPEANQARYGARNPAETIAFFGLEPGMTVVEGLPGGGWYSRILIPFIGPEGKLVGAHYPDTLWPIIMPDGDPDRIAAFIARSDGWADGTADWGIENGAKVSQFKMTTASDEMYGKADAYLFIRALHNVHRAEAEAGMFTATVEEAYKIVKPGGIVGVVQHRGPEDNSDAWADGSSGYLKQSAVVSAFEAAGFVLEATSELNANEADQPSEEDAVWRLPPRMAGSEEGSLEREAVEAIGESDRMTLLFRKPA